MSDGLKKVIALVGLPGGGKSTVGRQLARRIGARFVDADAELEAHFGMPIKAFFAEFGESAFRDQEEQAMERLTQPGAELVILATGGGAVLRPGNRQRLKDRCTVVYLRSTPDELFRRLRHDTQRPLLQVADPKAKLKSLYDERHPLYEEVAHYSIDTGRPSVATLVNMITMQLEMAGLIPPAGLPAGDLSAPTA
ncbi:MAG: shikimate kinase [Aquabacterium sp.]